MLKTVVQLLLRSRRPGNGEGRQLAKDANDASDVKDTSDRPRGPKHRRRRTKHTDPDNPPAYTTNYRKRPHHFIRDLAAYHIPKQLEEIPLRPSKPKPIRKRGAWILALDDYIVSYTEYEVDRQLRSGRPDLNSPRAYKDSQGLSGSLWRSKPWHTLTEQIIAHEVEKEIRKYIRRHAKQHGSPPSWPEHTQQQPDVEYEKRSKTIGTNVRSRAAQRSQRTDLSDTPSTTQHGEVSKSPPMPGSTSLAFYPSASSRSNAPPSVILQSPSPQQFPREQTQLAAPGPSVFQPASPALVLAPAQLPAAPVPAPAEASQHQRDSIKFSNLSPDQREYLVTALSQRIESNITQHALEILQGLDEHSPTGLRGAGIDDIVERTIDRNRDSTPL